MAKVLFLAHRYPYPPNKGDKIRAFHIAEHLRRSHQVSLGFVTTPADGEPDLSWADALPAQYFGRISTVDRLQRAAGAFPSGQPLSVAAFRHRGLARWVEERLHRDQPDFV